MLDNLIAGLRALFGRNRRNAEIHSELQSFLDASVCEKMLRGMTRDQALRAARAEIGSAESVRHGVWSAGWESTVESLLRDIHYGFRQLARNKAFTATATSLLPSAEDAIEFQELAGAPVTVQVAPELVEI